MPVRDVHDTISDKDATRLKIHKEISGGVPTTAYDYTDGTTVIVEKSHEGNKSGLKEIREVRRVISPKFRTQIAWKPGQYEKVFGHD